MKQRIVETAIASYSRKGDGIGIVKLEDGTERAAVIPFTAVGDHVRAEVRKKRGGKWQCRLLEVAAPSPIRQEPRCLHFGECGGCRWQHLPYEEQLRVKEERLRTLFSSAPEEAFHPIIPCTPPWNYRNKMEFTFSSDKRGSRYLGLMLAGEKGKVFNLKECHLPLGWYSEAVELVRSWWLEREVDAYHPPRNSGSLRTLTLRDGQKSGDKMAILTVSGNPAYPVPKKALNELADILDSRFPGISVVLTIQQIAKGKPTRFYEMILKGKDTIRETLTLSINEQAESLDFFISPSAFFQPNPRQAEKLYSKAVELAGISQDDIVYDLYSGTGTLGLCAALAGAQVISIEQSREAVLDAKRNASHNGCHEILVIQGNVEEVLNEKDDLPNPSVILLDPPRTGLHPKALEQIRRLSPGKIVYISCNPQTQKEDIDKLSNYRLTALQPVDQFPHTYHLENIALLSL